MASALFHNPFHAVLETARRALHAVLETRNLKLREAPYTRRRRLVRRPILPVLFILHHRKVRLVSALGDIMVFQSLQHGTTWFVCMRTIIKPAPLREVEDLAEIARQLLRLHIERPESLDSWRINQPSTAP